MRPPRLRETDLYPPLAAFLEEQGYTVHAEVKGRDIAARRGEELLSVEMKLHFNLDVILQAADRQTGVDAMYIAVPLTGKSRRPPRWTGLRKMLRRLGIGVFFVRFAPPLPPCVEEALPPETPGTGKTAKTKKNGRQELITEMEGRPGNFNTGGSSKKKIVTAYRVQALLIARLLRGTGGLSPKTLRQRGAAENCTAILYQNYYGWFARSGRGIYRLSPAGEAALVEYANVLKAMVRPRS
ncbi:MAG: DUF2161 family putative PD-(D/E)XK-type phosphodiesterase [Spirochaetales bacterium]|jgi:hypothetical protein|nr:DUF2161 family putative PD-(D/E)XK-type phosphodiesterase [Spirochaetales bacterium]